VASWRSTAPSTAPQAPRVGDEDRLGGDVVLGLGERSAAIQSGLAAPSARISTSEGPAIMSMPDRPNTRRFAAAT